MLKRACWNGQLCRVLHLLTQAAMLPAPNSAKMAPRCSGWRTICRERGMVSMRWSYFLFFLRAPKAFLMATKRVTGYLAETNRHHSQACNFSPLMHWQTTCLRRQSRYATNVRIHPVWKSFVTIFNETIYRNWVQLTEAAVGHLRNNRF